MAPGPTRIFLGCSGVMAGSLLWAADWVHVVAGVLMGIGWVLIAWGLVLLKRRPA